MYIRQFQFHKGTIRTEIFRMRNRQLQEYFNSIKVRLERGTNKVLVSDTGFQFHKGTIRTGHIGCTLSDSYVFQFHKGTIRTRKI